MDRNQQFGRGRVNTRDPFNADEARRVAVWRIIESKMTKGEKVDAFTELATHGPGRVFRRRLTGRRRMARFLARLFRRLIQRLRWQETKQ